MNSEIHVYLGTEPKLWLASEVLRYSILRRTQAKVIFHDLALLEFDPYLRLPTPAFNRWLVPYFAQYEGKALYLDARAIVLEDIVNLMSLPNEKGVLACPIVNPPGTQGFYTGVMVLDNSKLRNWKPKEWIQACQKDPQRLAKIMHALPGSPNHPHFAPLAVEWFAQDHGDFQSKLIHFDNPTLYPWSNPGHSAKLFFLKELQAAIQDQQISLIAILKEMQAGKVYPALLEEMTKNS